MINLIFFIVCFGASAAGAVCGIGGGVIIKPVLDAFGVMSVSAISFLSGCTVLSMTTYSVIRSKCSGQSSFDRHTGLPLAVGAAMGGVAGKSLFSALSGLCPDQNQVGAIQSLCLMAVTVGTLLYTVKKSRIPTHRIQNPGLCGIIGLLLGILSSFLGIGGGPINLVVLFFFFSMTTKTAAENSLYIIFFSQLASLILSLVTGSIPEFSPAVLILMAGGGILGGICGRAMNKRLRDQTVDRLFMGIMIVIILICAYNIRKYIG